MGRRRPDDPRNDLIFSFARLVEELEPRSFVIENVPGLLFPRVRSKLEALVGRLREAGYTLQSVPPVCLDAADYGVPQRRRRVFIIGVAEGLSVPETPVPRLRTSVSDALNDLPDVDGVPDLLYSDQLRLTAAQLRRLERAASSYAASLRTPFSLEYPREWDPALLTGSQRTIHKASVRARFASLSPGSEDETSRTSRLNATGVAPTLRAGTGRDHGSFTAPRPIHHIHHRVVTVREAARLHSFPDWFRFHITKWHALREIGNAVPPRLAAAVAETVVKALGFSPGSPQRCLELGSDALLGMSLVEAARHFNFDETLLPYDVRRRPSGR